MRRRPGHIRPIVLWLAVLVAGAGAGRLLYGSLPLWMLVALGAVWLAVLLVGIPILVELWSEQERTGLTLRQQFRARAGRCIQCGYALRGNETGRCPECGRTWL